MDTFNNAGGAMSTQMVAGDKPMAVALDNVKVEVSKVSEDQDEEDTGVSVPKELMGGANVGVMVCHIEMFLNNFF